MPDSSFDRWSGSNLDGGEPTGLKADIVTSRPALETCAGEWNELLASSAADTIFLRWEWVSTWLDVVYPEAELLVVLVRDADQRLVGIAPFYVARMWALHWLPLRCLRVLGASQSGAEYPDVILRRGWEGPVLQRLAECLRSQTCHWDCLWLSCVAPWTGASERWRTLVGNDFRREEEVPCSYVSLPDSFDKYRSQLSRGARRRLRCGQRAAEGLGRTVLVRCREADQVQPMLSDLIDLHGRRWQSAGQLGSFARRPRFTAFCRRFAPQAFARGWLRCYALRAGDRLVATQIGFRYGRDYLGLQGGYDPQVSNGGHLLLAAIIEDLIQEGARGFDFLAGAMDYKTAAGGRMRSGVHIFAGRRCWKNYLVFGAGLWPKGRYMRHGPPESLGRGADQRSIRQHDPAIIGS